MSNINEIVEVVITRGAQTVSRQGFGVPLILGSNCSAFGATEVIRTYTDLDGVLVDFPITTREYKLANIIFSQDIRPTYLKIGKAGVAVKKKVTIGITTVVHSGVYSITINGHVYTYTADSTATELEILTGLIAAITAGAEPVTMVPGTVDFTIEANVAGVDFTIAIPLNGYLSLTSTEVFTVSPEVALASIRNVDTDFYFILSTSQTAADITKIAAYTETLMALFVCNSSDSLIGTTATTDILSTLKAANYDRTILAYSALEYNALAEAWVSMMAPRDPGSATWKFKSGTGIIDDTYNDTIKNIIKGKNGNTYTTVAGVSIFENGTVVSGEWIDIMQGIDWIKTNIQADIYQTLANEDKIDYTSDGIEVIASIILAVLKTAVTMGILSSDVTPTVVTPSIATISAVDKAARLLKDIKFYGTLAGAIHKVGIAGKVNV